MKSEKKSFLNTLETIDKCSEITNNTFKTIFKKNSDFDERLNLPFTAKTSFSGRMIYVNTDTSKVIMKNDNSSNNNIVLSINKEMMKSSYCINLNVRKHIIY